VSIVYDEVGNPVNDGNWLYAWEHGRQLKTLYDGVDNWTFEYDANGMRTKRYCDWCGYQYIYSGSQLTQMKFEGSTLNFTYDASGTPLTMSIGNAVYYYVTNLQGDVVKLLDGAGNTVAAYSYDAWGVGLAVTGTKATSIGMLNPLRYRGYVYDVETGLYYLQSRYYDPQVGRFLNADVFYSTGQGFVGNNMFAYCNNNPVCFQDPAGSRMVPADRIYGGSAPKEIRRDEWQLFSEKLVFFMFELGYAVLDGVEFEIALGMGFGGTASFSIFGIPVDADLFATTKLSIVMENGLVDIRSTTSFAAGLPFSDYFGIDAAAGISHSLFDPQCTCHINSTWNEFMSCIANKPFYNSSPTIGLSAGAYFLVGVEIGIGYNFETFIDSVIRRYNDVF